MGLFGWLRRRRRPAHALTEGLTSTGTAEDLDAALEKLPDALAPLSTALNEMMSVPEADLLSSFKSESVKMILSNLGFFSVRVMMAGALFELAKLALRRLVQKHRRAGRVFEYMDRVLLPVTFFGPALGIATGLLELLGFLPPLGPRALLGYSVSGVCLPVTSSVRGVRAVGLLVFGRRRRHRRVPRHPLQELLLPSIPEAPAVSQA